jgi:hypothetical protein
MACSRSCPRCTLLTSNQDATTCELCGAALPRLGPPASAQPKVTGKRKQPPADAKQRGIAAFFGGGGNGAGRGAPAAAPSAVSAAPSTAASVPSVPHAAPTPARAQAMHAASPPARPSQQLSVQLALDDGPPPDLSLPLAQYQPFRAGWQPGTPVPYAHVAAALDAVSATRSRLAKELALTNAMRAPLALGACAADLEALCYLLSPAKDAQSGGHRLRPDWSTDRHVPSQPRLA